MRQQIRELASKPNPRTYTGNDWKACYFVQQWRTSGKENLDDLTPDEWFLFCNLVACALESEQ
jgi:hypothetical protein